MNFVVILSGMFLLIAPSVVHAGAVYKCRDSGATVYQDAPCKDGSEVKSQIATSRPPLGSANSLGELARQIQAASATERQLQSDMNRDIARTKARLGSKVNDPSSDSEVARIRNEWLPKIRAAQGVSEALMAELRKRCPHGAAINASSPSCSA